MATTPIKTIYVGGFDKHSTFYKDDNGIIYQTVPERLPFDDRDDTIIHICKGGETLLTLAVAYYKDIFQGPIDFWRVIGEFQEHPIQEPAVPFKTGDLVLIPSKEYIQEVFLGDSLEEWPEIE